jgi:hypothetical protein
MNRKARDRRIAEEIVDELTKELGGPVMPEALTANPETVGAVFGRVLDRRGIVNESAAACILKCMGRALAKNFRNRQLDAAMRQGKIP